MPPHRALIFALGVLSAVPGVAQNTSVGSKGSATGKFGEAGKLPKEFGTVNEFDCRNPDVLFAGELTNWRVQRLTLRR